MQTERPSKWVYSTLFTKVHGKQRKKLLLKKKSEEKDDARLPWQRPFEFLIDRNNRQKYIALRLVIGRIML